MPRGGKRPGAGRKPGSVSEKTRQKRELAARVAQQGVTPLEVMTRTMQALWDQTQPDQSGVPTNLGKAMQAVVIAEKVAPYVHPRLAAVAAEINPNAKNPFASLADTIRQMTQEGQLGDTGKS